MDTYQRETHSIVENASFDTICFLSGCRFGRKRYRRKIPIDLFINEMERFFNIGVQTDGSSVVLHGIATLNNARVDLVLDLSVNWFVDYNFEHICEDTGLPIGTLRIPAYLMHNLENVDSRSILKGL